MSSFLQGMNMSSSRICKKERQLNKTAKIYYALKRSKIASQLRQSLFA